MKSWRWTIAAALVLTIMLVALATWSGLADAAGLAYKDEMFETGASVATALFVITVFVERTMGVLNALLFGDRQRNAEIQFAQAPADPVAAKALGDVFSLKERVRLLLSFAAGLFISAAGVRTLEGLLTATAPPDPRLFHAVDIILTAGLIAGGSNGLAFLIELLKGRLADPVEEGSNNADPALNAAPQAAIRTAGATKETLATRSTRALRARLTTTS